MTTYTQDNKLIDTNQFTDIKNRHNNSHTSNIQIGQLTDNKHIDITTHRYKTQISQLTDIKHRYDNLQISNIEMTTHRCQTWI